MGLEEGISSKELDQDAADAPDVTRVRPAKAEYDFRSPVVAGAHNRRMILVLEGGRPEIDQPDFGV